MPAKQNKRQWPRTARTPTKKPTAALRLKTLPLEIVQQIIPLLDPIALISLSQTDRYFRRLISPGRAEFVDRLLALECLDEYGGSASIIHASVCPRPASSAEWETIKWACTSCMRLLPHTYFENHAIQRFRYRKPIPGTPAVEAATKWRISLRGKVQGGKAIKHIPPLELNQTRRGQRKKDDWIHPANVSRYLDRLQEVGIRIEAKAGEEPPTLETKQAAMEQVLETLQLHRWGFKRHLRRCHECRYQAGQLNQHPMWRTPISNLRTSRRFLYAGMLERYFPQYWTVLKHQRPQLPQDRTMEVWNTYMGRCHICRSWQEMRSFRLGLTHGNDIAFTDKNWHDYNADRPDYFNSLECNRCVAKTQGHEALGKTLLKWINELIVKEEMRFYHHIVRRGFADVRISLVNLSYITRTKSKQRSQLDTMFEIDPQAYARCLSRDDERELLMRHHEDIKTTWEDLLSHDSEFALFFSDKSDETDWVRKLPMYQAYWVWLGDTSRELNERPLALVRWAINGRQAQ
ncbi:unnamed protein product [Clonostachys solani]|uniref:F-box domain-containing protein n=1 Tax=Clonostachys solani TaxID=160281 RepID=A0A9N9YYH9_9HYPO|nr:unnamed protein product [Clonostachys solani]